MKVIQVNKKDQVLGLVDKDQAHKLKGIFHRAFSILVINKKGEVLLQKRSRYKKLWPLHWTNTCCSHPQGGETYIAAAKKRLKEEMGFACKLKPLFKFQYQAIYKNIGSENEISTVLIGRFNKQKIKPDKKEAADFRWISLQDLNKEIKHKPEIFTPWFIKIINQERFFDITND